MVTIRDISKAAGVSLETVSRVINGKYKGRTEKSRMLMKKILREAARRHYRPHNAARSMRTSSTGLIGVVFEEGSLGVHPVINETLKGINEALERENYNIVITSLSGIKKATLESRIFREHLLDGIIIIDNIGSEEAQSIRSLIPSCVMLNMNYWRTYCCVRRDEHAAGLTAGTELLRLGYRHAMYFDILCDDKSLENAHYCIGDRLKGFRTGFMKKGNKIDIIRIYPEQIHGYMSERANKITRDTVLVAAHNLRLFCLASSLSSLPVKVGKDCGLVSLDDENSFRVSFPQLSRVAFPRVEIGRRAGQMMISLLKGKMEECKSSTFKGEWICGTTTPQIS
ncbi:MAG: LacI family DNA-binding transcriptional regulator [Victivallales bacterium]